MPHLNLWIFLPLESNFRCQGLVHFSMKSDLWVCLHSSLHFRSLSHTSRGWKITLVRTKKIDSWFTTLVAILPQLERKENKRVGKTVKHIVKKQKQNNLWFCAKRPWVLLGFTPTPQLSLFMSSTCCRYYFQQREFFKIWIANNPFYLEYCKMLHGKWRQSALRFNVNIFPISFWFYYY